MNYYIRFGDIPKNEQSHIVWRSLDFGYEKGVSVYDCVQIRGKYHLVLPNPYNDCTFDDIHGFICYDDKPCYLCTRDFVGYGIVIY